MQKTVAGRLFIPGLERTYWLLHPHPIPHSDSWMRDDLATFYAALDTGAEPLTACHVTVRGPFVIDPTHTGRKIALKESVEIEADFVQQEESVFNMLTPAEMPAEN